MYYVLFHIWNWHMNWGLWKKLKIWPRVVTYGIRAYSSYYICYYSRFSKSWFIKLLYMRIQRLVVLSHNWQRSGGVDTKPAGMVPQCNFGSNLSHCGIISADLKTNVLGHLGYFSFFVNCKIWASDKILYTRPILR